MKRNFTGFAIILSGSIIISSCGNKQAPQNPAAQAIPVNTYQVSREAVTGVDVYPGTVVALNEVELRAEVNGYITGIFVNDGQRVSKGQKLYEIDRVRYQAAYNQAEAQLQTAKANLEKVRKDLERYTRLEQQDAIARQTVDYARADVQTAEAQVNSARAAVSSAANDLKHSIITAPVSGTIGIAEVKPGSLVSAGTTLINSISSPNPIGVDFYINEQDIPRFQKFRQTKNLPDSLFTLQLPDGSLYAGSGKIYAMDRAVNPQTSTLRVRLSFPNSTSVLTPGMTCTVRVLNQNSGEQLVIPYKAVTEQMGEFFVYAVGDSNKVSQQKVSLGTSAGDKVVIKEGLKEGETIVSDGVQNLRPGATVTTGGPAAQTPPASK